jgi:hypothetical protein
MPSTTNFQSTSLRCAASTATKTGTHHWQCAAAGEAAGVLVTMAGVGIVVRNAAGERVRGHGGPPTLYVAMAEPNVLYAVLDDEVVAVNRVV